MSVNNGEKYLREAVDSILNQSFTNFEFIIINDGSSDDTSRILGSYHDHRIIQINNGKNIGLTASLNRGLVRAKGVYFARQDADDKSHPDRLSIQLEYLQANPHIGMVGSCPWTINEAGERIGQLCFPLTPNFEDPELTTNPFCHGSVVIRHSVLDLAGGYREFYKVSQDHDLWRRLSEHCKLVNLNRPLYDLRVHQESISRTRNTEQIASRQVVLELSRQRQSKGIDDFGLPYQGKWDERLTTTRIHRNMRSYRAYIRAYCNNVGRRGIAKRLMWLSFSLILLPTNRLSLSLKQHHVNIWAYRLRSLN